MTPKRGKLIQVSTYLSPELAIQLKDLSDRTRVSQAAYFREAIEELLKKYEDKAPKLAGKPAGAKGRK
jgi:predicted DNA-binding protein